MARRDVRRLFVFCVCAAAFLYICLRRAVFRRTTEQILWTRNKFPPPSSLSLVIKVALCVCVSSHLLLLASQFSSCFSLERTVNNCQPTNKIRKPCCCCVQIYIYTSVALYIVYSPCAVCFHRAAFLALPCNLIKLDIGLHFIGCRN